MQKNEKREAEKRVKVSEMIVVEGLHDKQRVDLVVEADVMVLGGDRIGQRTFESIRRALKSRGVIVLTDPDGAGERIRRRIDALVPGCKHAYVSRNRATAKTGVGVEHASVEDVRNALLEARSPAVGEESDTVRFTLTDLLQSGLSGVADAAERREQLGDILGIGYGNAKAFLRKLNAFRVTREEFDSALERLR